MRTEIQDDDPRSQCPVRSDRWTASGQFSPGISKGKRAISQRRHTLSMIHIFDQTDTAAKARAQARLGGTNNDGKFISQNVNASYNFWLVKQDGHWKINKMYIESDGGLGTSPLPKGAKYEPDDRMEKKK